MTWGTYARDLIEGYFSNTQVVTILTLTPLTSTGTGDGGYTSPTYTTGSARSINAIPTTYVKDKINYEKFGTLSTGDLTFLVSASETINKEDKVTYSSTGAAKDFFIKTINPILLTGTVVAQEIVMAKDLG